MANGGYESEISRLISDVAAIRKFLWESNGTSMNTRVERLEYISDESKALLGKLKTFLDIQADRAEQDEKRDKTRWWKNGLAVAALMFLMNVLWSLLKPKLGLS